MKLRAFDLFCGAGGCSCEHLLEVAIAVRQLAMPHVQHELVPPVAVLAFGLRAFGRAVSHSNILC